MNNPNFDYQYRKLEERLHKERERVRELREALCEIITWTRDIAGDCDDEQQREDELNMIERMDALIAKHNRRE